MPRESDSNDPSQAWLTDAASEVRDPATIILAIGASGAKTDSLVRVLRGLPRRDDLAVVVVLQHHEALDFRAFRGALGEQSGALIVPRDGQALTGGLIHLPPANQIVTIEEGLLRLRPAESNPGERATIDSFLVSAAQDQDGNVIALMLDGTEGDGTLGISVLKESGGLTLAEATEESRTQSLQNSNSPVALADYVLPIASLPDRIELHVRCLKQLREAGQPDGRVVDETN